MGSCCKPEIQPSHQYNQNPQTRDVNLQVKQSPDAQKAYQLRQSQLKQEEKKLINQRESLLGEKQMLEVRMNQQNKQISERITKQKESASQLQSKQNTVRKLQQEIAGVKKQVEKKTAEINCNNYQAPKSNEARIPPLHTINKNTSELDKRINQLTQLLSKETRQRDQLVAERNKMDQQIQTLQNQMKQAQQRIERLKFEHQQIINETTAMKQKFEESQLELSQTREAKRFNSLQIEKIKRETYQLQEQRKVLNAQIQSMAQNVVQNNKSYLQFFTGEILEEEEFNKEYLTEVLQNRLRTKIVSTKLIYRYDTLNKVNFHKYIDGKENLVVLVKLSNEYMLGAWTQGAFVPRVVSDKDGLIFSLTNKKCFQPLERNRRVIAYDDFFLIFGNSELRLKALDNKVFSNFAINNGYFNPRGEKVNILLGSGGVREVQMEKLEIFQLVLQ